MTLCQYCTSDYNNVTTKKATKPDFTDSQLFSLNSVKKSDKNLSDIKGNFN